MSEKQLSLPEIFLVVFDFVIVGGFIFFVVMLLSSFRVNIESNDLQRVASELAENIMVNGLTDSRFVFDKAELDNFDGTASEPYVRHCSYAYHLDVEAKSKINEKDRWSIGYKTNQFATLNRLGEAVFETPAAVKGLDEKGKTVVVAGKMKITVYSTIVGAVGCMVENAFYTKDTQSVPAICTKEKATFCDLAIAKADGKICFVTDYQKYGKFSDPDAECREFDNKIPFAGISYSFAKDDKRRVLNAIPLTAVLTGVQSCSDVVPYKATKADAVASVALCLEEVKK